MVSFHNINFFIKDHPSRGPGMQSRWRFPAAMAHLPFKRPFRRPGLLSRRRFCGQGPPYFQKTTVSLRFISGRVHIPMKVSWPMPTFLMNKTTYIRGPRLLSRLRFQAAMAYLIFLPLRGGWIFKIRGDRALCPPSHCNEVWVAMAHHLF